jgi:hypothetical protein
VAVFIVIFEAIAVVKVGTAGCSLHPVNRTTSPIHRVINRTA